MPKLKRTSKKKRPALQQTGGCRRPSAGCDLPSLEALCYEVFGLVEYDQGKGFVFESNAKQHRDHAQFFDRVRACESHTRIAANKLRSFLRKYGR